MGYIKRNGISYFGGKQVELTQAEYDALPDTKLTDGVIYCITDGTSSVDTAFYGVCNTAGNVAAKEVNILGFTSEKLVAGVTVRVLFIYHNEVTSPTLNVSNTGAINMYRYGTSAPGTNSTLSWNDEQVVTFTYDGSAWRMAGYTRYTNVEIANKDDTNTLYPITFGRTNSTSTTTQGLYKSNNLTYNPQYHYLRIAADATTHGTLQAVRDSSLANDKYAIVRATDTSSTTQDFGIEMLANGNIVSLAYMSGGVTTHLLSVDSNGNLSGKVIDTYGFVEGTSGTVATGLWTYRKWNNGTLEVWAHQEYTESITFNSWGGVYSHDSAAIPGSSPVAFVRIDFSVGSYFISGLNGFGSLRTDQSGYIFMRGATASAGNYSVWKYVYRKGTWK